MTHRRSRMQNSAVFHGKAMELSQSSALRADDALRSCYSNLNVASTEELNWEHYDRLIESIERSAGRSQWPESKNFEYVHPVRLQNAEFGVGKPYAVRLSYSDAGGSGEPVVAIGGLTNVKQRFDFFALDSKPEMRLIALELAGRGESGWLAEISDYSLDTYVEQLAQFMKHLGLERCTFLGSSLGASVAMRFAAGNPRAAQSLILNDSGPYLPAQRRRRRAKAVARHYEFTTPFEMFRRTGAAAKHAGPTLDAVMLRNAHYKTRWSDAGKGRVYRHDLRSMLVFRAESVQSLDLWREWSKLNCPILLLHGMLRDAITTETIDRMQRGNDAMSVIHVAQTGHTPSLSFAELTRKVVRWRNDADSFDWQQTYAVSCQRKRILYPNG